MKSLAFNEIASLKRSAKQRDSCCYDTEQGEAAAERSQREISQEQQMTCC
jgi:hypothetical protein